MGSGDRGRRRLEPLTAPEVNAGSEAAAPTPSERQLWLWRPTLPVAWAPLTLRPQGIAPGYPHGEGARLERRRLTIEPGRRALSSGGSVHGYRLYFFDRLGLIRRLVEITSVDDDHAIAEVLAHRDGRAMELWDERRRVKVFPSS